MIIELKCKRCDTGIFKVEDIARGLGKLPLRLTCHICGMQYIVKPDETGRPAVFYRKYRERYRKMEVPGLGPAPEPAPAEEPPAPEPEESPEEVPEPLPEQESQVISPEDVGKVEGVLGELAETPEEAEASEPLPDEEATDGGD